MCGSDIIVCFVLIFFPCWNFMKIHKGDVRIVVRIVVVVAVVHFKKKIPENTVKPKLLLK